jgi:hypothetical protein
MFGSFNPHLVHFVLEKRRHSVLRLLNALNGKRGILLIFLESGACLPEVISEVSHLKANFVNIEAHTLCGRADRVSREINGQGGLGYLRRIRA